ncbi:hypothetical protein FF38_00118 [Lucilia cuprina]|uniref:Uncharacterized protein n=1 Tax=Lucilia cuprina TaxID=7375 RepID=A0A0L0BL01_LUCCU|nr:hypothetical protein FF38_00118 [Lucilia cuprina]
MQATPRAASFQLILCISFIIEIHISTNVSPLVLTPKRSLNCEVKMIREPALVKPALTGPETKSIRKPNRNTPIPISMSPVKKVSKTAFCQTPCAVWKVSKAEIAVGPTGTSLLLIEEKKLYIHIYKSITDYGQLP